MKKKLKYQSYYPKRFWSFLRSTYRFSISSTENAGKQTSFSLSSLSIFLITIFATVFIISLTSVVLLFTPLKKYMPGYVDTHTRNNIIQNAFKLDSLYNTVAIQTHYIDNILAILKGEVSPDTILPMDSLTLTVNPDSLIASFKTKKFIEVFEEEEKYNLTNKTTNIPTDGLFFYKPVQTATITNKFDYAHRHFGIDLMTQSKGAVLSTLDGTVVLCSSDEYGNIIQIQHNNNFISIYKHASQLLKKEGDKIKAGEAIAIVKDNANDGQKGAHLHFELWYKGTPLNPEEYIIF